MLPIFRQGDRTSSTNYRPISLTSICCKMLEHIILHNLHLQLTDILSVYQHGFRNHLSCTTQLDCVAHDIYRNIDKRVSTHAVVLDFSKAFDMVPYHILVQKLINNNISPLIVRWISSFLEGRTQQVVLNGIKSQPVQVSSGPSVIWSSSGKRSWSSIIYTFFK